LRAEVHDCFRQASIACPPLLPGDYFQPCYLDVPSKPKADFLWAGIRSMVVSERIKELFEGMEMRSGFFCPVTLRRIGRRNARLPARIPSTGEPEDIINKAPLLASTGSVGKYYEFVLEAKSGCAPEIERLSVPLTVCSGCGYKTFPSRSPTLEFFMDDSMWKGHDIFFLAVSHYKVISDKLRTALCQLNATNVEISQFCTSRPSR